MIRALKVAPVLAFTLALALGGPARAADTKAVVAEIEGHDKAFLAAYENGETKKMKTEIAKAVALGEKNGLGSDAVMADTYVLAAIYAVDGNDDAKAGVREFVKALKIKADVAIPKGMATSGVKAALKQAKVELGLLPKDGAAPAVAAAPAGKPAETSKPAEGEKSEPADKAEKAKTGEKEQEKAQQEKQERERQAKQQEQAKQEQAKQEQARAEQAKQEQARAEQAKQDKLQKEVAQKDKASKAESDKQLADARARIQQLEKDKADRDKQLADGRAHTQQLERDRAAQDKQLADVRAQAGKDREALDKIAHDKQVADTQARDAENKKRQEREQRERQFAGPEMPARLREALTCEVPDEAPLRTDLFVHCVARPNVKAKSIIFYYRAGSAHYFSVPMERTAKGWYAAIVPGVRVVGKVLQYYAEALDGRESVVANNGKETSPNILSLRPGGPRS